MLKRYLYWKRWIRPPSRPPTGFWRKRADAPSTQGSRASSAGGLPGNRPPGQLKKLARSGRWQIASSGPGVKRREPLANRLKGNPYTHPIYTNDRMETKRPFAKRLNRTFAGGGRASLPEESSALLILFVWRLRPTLHRQRSRLSGDLSGRSRSAL